MNAVLLRAALAELLLPRGGLVVHASAVVDEGKAWLFPGPSGCGKTTLAMGSARPLLSDDTVVLTVDGDQVTAHGTPFTSEGGRPGTPLAAPLGGVVGLEWGTEVHAAGVGASGVFRLVATNLFLPPAPAALRRLAIGLSLGVADRVPGFHLVFPRDYRFGFRDLTGEAHRRAG